MQQHINFAILIVSLFAIVLVVSLIARYVDSKSKRHLPWWRWAEILKPFEGILTEAGCDFVSKAESKKFFSKRDEYSRTEFPHHNNYYIRYMELTRDRTNLNWIFETNKVKIIFDISNFSPSPLELLLTLGSVNCRVYNVSFIFKTQIPLKCTIYKDISYFLYSANYNCEIEYFPSSERLFKFVEEKLLLDLFT